LFRFFFFLKVGTDHVAWCGTSDLSNGRN
jgi:hypothetical protein